MKISKQGKRKVRNPSAGLSLSSWPRFFADQPKTLKVLLRYTEVMNMPAIGAGNISKIIYRGNDLYDPYYAAGGHQPYGFDQLCVRFSRFTVMSTRMAVETLDTSANLTEVIRIYPSRTATDVDDAYAAGGVAAIEELPFRSTSIQPAGGMQEQKNRETSVVMNHPQWFGRTPSEYLAETNNQCSATFSPVNQDYLIVAGYSPNLAAVGATPLKITLTYHVLATDPIRMIPS